MKILFVSLSPYGTIGYTGSYMISTLVSKKSGFMTYLVLNEDELTDKTKSMETQEVFEDTLLLPKGTGWAYKFGRIFSMIQRVQPDIVHVFYHSRGFLLPTFWKTTHPLAKAPKWIIDIRSPQVLNQQRKWYKAAMDPLKQLGFDVVSSHAEASIQSQFGFCSKPYFLMPPGVDLKLVQKPDFSKDPEVQPCSSMIYIGAITRTRRIDRLVEILGYVKNNLKPEFDFRVDLFGEGDGVHEVIKKIKELKLKQNVFYQGVVPQKELLQKMPAYDLGLAFIPYEQFSKAPALKTIEYMASGLFVVGSDTEGNRMFVENGVSGILAENTDEAFGGALLEAVQSGLPRSFKEKAWLTAQKWDWQKLIDQRLIPVYNKLMKKR